MMPRVSQTHGRCPARFDLWGAKGHAIITCGSRLWLLSLAAFSFCLVCYFLASLTLMLSMQCDPVANLDHWERDRRMANVFVW